MSKLRFIGSWSLSKQLEIEHRSIKAMIDRYLNEFEQWGLIAERTVKTISPLGGANVKEYILNEKQVNYLVMLLWNTDKVREVKKGIINGLM